MSAVYAERAAQANRSVDLGDVLSGILGGRTVLLEEVVVRELGGVEVSIERLTVVGREDSDRTVRADPHDVDSTVTVSVSPGQGDPEVVLAAFREMFDGSFDRDHVREDGGRGSGDRVAVDGEGARHEDVSVSSAGAGAGTPVVPTVPGAVTPAEPTSTISEATDIASGVGATGEAVESQAPASSAGNGVTA